MTQRTQIREPVVADLEELEAQAASDDSVAEDEVFQIHNEWRPRTEPTPCSSTQADCLIDLSAEALSSALRCFRRESVDMRGPIITAEEKAEELKCKAERTSDFINFAAARGLTEAEAYEALAYYVLHQLEKAPVA